MDEATRDRIGEHAVLASWLRFAPRLPELATAIAGPQAVVDWLEACAPGAKAGVEELLRAMQGQPWCIATTGRQTLSNGRQGFVVHAGSAAWAVSLRAGPGLVVSGVERLPAGSGGAAP